MKNGLKMTLFHEKNGSQANKATLFIILKLSTDKELKDIEKFISNSKQKVNQRHT